MRNIVIVLAAAALVVSVSVLSCNDSPQDSETTQNTVTDSLKIKDSINAKYMKDIADFKKQIADTISAYNKSIADFKVRIQDDNDEVKTNYNKRIAELEQKSHDMKKKMDDYQADGKDKWEIFKTQFSHGMDELGKSFTDLTKKNK